MVFYIMKDNVGRYRLHSSDNSIRVVMAFLCQREQKEWEREAEELLKKLPDSEGDRRKCLFPT